MIGDRLEKLVADLTSSRDDRRAAAKSEVWKALEERSEPEALERLATLLEPMADSKLAWDRAFAIQSIGGIRAERSLPLLEKHADDPDSEVRAAVEDIAEDIGEPGRPLLKKLVKDPDFAVRFWAAATLSESGDADGCDVLIEGLSIAGTRFEALQGLRRLGDKRGEPAARRVLGKWFLAAIDRVAALGLLASIGDAEAKARLLDEIQKRRSDGRGLAMQIAGEIKLAEAVPVLEGIFRDKGEPQRGAAAMAMAEMKLEKVLPELAAVLGDEGEDFDTRDDVVWALQRFGSDQALAALREALPKVSSEVLRKEIEEAVAKVEKERKAQEQVG